MFGAWHCGVILNAIAPDPRYRKSFQRGRAIFGPVKKFEVIGEIKTVKLSLNSVHKSDAVIVGRLWHRWQSDLFPGPSLSECRPRAKSNRPRR